MASRGAIALLVVLAGLLTACGSDDGDNAGVVDPAERQAAEEWTAAVCGSLLEWQDAIGVLAEAGEPETRADFLTFFAASLAATKQLVRELEGAGVPEVADGEIAARTYVEAFTRARQLTADALERAETLPDDTVTDEQRAGVLELYQEGYQDVSDTFAEARDRIDSPALEEAFADNPDCAAVS